MHLACQRKNKIIAEMLIKKGIDFNKTDDIFNDINKIYNIFSWFYFENLWLKPIDYMDDLKSLINRISL